MATHPQGAGNYASGSIIKGCFSHPMMEAGFATCETSALEVGIHI